jgi:cyclic beta-1,2-glucan synthetase
VRTRISDDRLWLPFIAAHYLEVTGDLALLDEEIPFIESPLLTTTEHEAYQLPVISDQRASFHEHCLRAIDRSLSLGAHGLPLMGGGDWNDGMNRVGAEGRGESVWLGWFVIATLERVIPWCERRLETARVARYREHVRALQQSLEQSGWDGGWYRRAYFDDGAPLGSAENSECRIDSIAQSWSVISGAGDPARARTAMAAVEANLLDSKNGILKVLTPPFRGGGAHDPGYIAGYVPGVRENGGQYTHAAIWAALAEALLGDGDRAGAWMAMLNPVRHASTRADVARYMVEPYVVAADVYGEAPHTGRGGWTWYTGSASWMYRVAVESFLGLRVSATHFTLQPCVPRDWPAYSIVYRRGATTWRIHVDNPERVCVGVSALSLDGKLIDDRRVPLIDDAGVHEVRVTLGAG